MARVRTVLPLLLAACGAVVGCSTDRPSPRPTPLPAGVEPSDLFNTRLETVPPADASAYYERDEATKVAVAQSSTGAKRAAHDAAGDRVGTSEVAVKQYLAAKRRQQEQAARVEAASRAAEAKQRAIRGQDVADAVKPVVEAGREGLLGMVQGTTLGWLVGPDLVGRLKTLPVTPDRAKTNELVNELAGQETPATEVLPGARYDLLLLSGGGSHGAYSAGVLCGWTDSGCRPRFDVVTGVSTGALVAAVAFAGCEYDGVLKRFYTGVHQRMLRGDIWRVKRLPPLGLGTESVATNAPLRAILEQVLTSPGYFDRVVAEHAAGRRLYIGTTNLDTQRFVVWDMGAIASEGTPEARKLYADVVLASAAIPVLLPPARIAVTIDGRRHEELHVDGGTTRNLFFYPPADWPGDAEDEKTGYKMLAGARVYAVVAGQVYDEPAGTDPKVLRIGVRTIGTMMSSLQRAEIFRIYSHCQDRRMNFHLAAIPPDFPDLFTPTQFEPGAMTRLFTEGYARAREGRVWNQEPPERAVSEDRARRSTNLTTTPSGETGTVTPGLAPRGRPFR